MFITKDRTYLKVTQPTTATLSDMHGRPVLEIKTFQEDLFFLSRYDMIIYKLTLSAGYTVLAHTCVKN